MGMDSQKPRGWKIEVERILWLKTLSRFKILEWGRQFSRLVPYFHVRAAQRFSMAWEIFAYMWLIFHGKM